MFSACYVIQDGMLLAGDLRTELSNKKPAKAGLIVIHLFIIVRFDYLAAISSSFFALIT